MKMTLLDKIDNLENILSEKIKRFIKQNDIEIEKIDLSYYEDMDGKQVFDKIKIKIGV
jgi:cellobiose-specific phosphotransferase system component IIB